MMRKLLMIAVLVLVASSVNAQRGFYGSANTGLTSKADLFFDVWNPEATGPLVCKRLATLTVPYSTTTFQCVGTGGTIDGSPACTMNLRECTSPDPSTCGSVSGDVTLTTLNTAVTATYSDSSWASANYMCVDLSSGSSAAGDCPTLIMCRAQAVW